MRLEALRAGYFLLMTSDSSPASQSSIYNFSGIAAAPSQVCSHCLKVPRLHPADSTLNPQGKHLCSFGSHAKRQRGDSNPCGQSPMDFESISLTARTHCHMFTANFSLPAHCRNDDICIIQLRIAGMMSHICIIPLRIAGMMCHICIIPLRIAGMMCHICIIPLWV